VKLVVAGGGKRQRNDAASRHLRKKGERERIEILLTLVKRDSLRRKVEKQANKKWKDADGKGSYGTKNCARGGNGRTVEKSIRCSLGSRLKRQGAQDREKTDSNRNLKLRFGILLLGKGRARWD